MATQPHTHTHRNTHSSGSTCHIPLSSDNIAAVKVAASVIGRTNHSRGDEMVPSRRSESRGGPRQRTSCQSPATEKEGSHSSFVASLYASTSFIRGPLCSIWPFIGSLSVRMAILVCYSVLMMLTRHLDSAFIWFCFHIIFYAPFSRSHL